MKRLIRKAEKTTFYHGTSLDNAISICNDGSFKTAVNQNGAASIYNHSLDWHGVYITDDFNTAQGYALDGNSRDFGVVFEIILDPEEDIIGLDEDTFYMGEPATDYLDNPSENENYQIFLNFFDGDRKAASDWVYKHYKAGDFDNITYRDYDTNEVAGTFNSNDLVFTDNDDYYYLDLAEIFIANPKFARELMKDIPWEKQREKGNGTYTNQGDISTDKVNKIYLINKNRKQFDFSTPQEFLQNYKEKTNE